MEKTIKIAMFDDVEIGDLFRFIKGEGRFSPGTGITGMSPPYGAGARTLLHIFQDAQFISGDMDLESRTGTQKTITSAKRTVPKKKKSKVPQAYSTDFSNKDKVYEAELGKSLGRVIVKGVGVIDIKDRKTLEIAKNFIEILSNEMDSSQEQ